MQYFGHTYTKKKKSLFICNSNLAGYLVVLFAKYGNLKHGNS